MIKKEITRLIPLPTKVLLIIVIIGFIIFFVISKYQQQVNAKQDKVDCYTELNKVVNGVVTKSFVDENPNHKGFVIEFTNGSKYLPKYLTKWQTIILNEGDSIYKKAGTFRVFVFKKGYENPIIIEDTLNCDKLRLQSF